MKKAEAFAKTFSDISSNENCRYDVRRGLTDLYQIWCADEERHADNVL